MRRPWAHRPRGAAFRPQMDNRPPPLPERSIGHPDAGRSSGFRIALLAAPSHRLAQQWLVQLSSPVTAAGPRRTFTGFPTAYPGQPAQASRLREAYYQ